MLCDSLTALPDVMLETILPIPAPRSCNLSQPASACACGLLLRSHVEPVEITRYTNRGHTLVSQYFA
eukprot:1927553-Pleurochrysis_carterae.AAC.1